MMNKKSEAAIALAEEASLLDSDTTRYEARANLEAKALAVEFPFMIFADGSVIESDPMAGSIKATPAGHWAPEKIQAFIKQTDKGQIPTPPMLTRVSEHIKSKLSTFSFPGSLRSQMRAVLEEKCNLMRPSQILGRDNSLAASFQDGWLALKSDTKGSILYHHKLDGHQSYGTERVDLPDMKGLVRTRRVENFCLDITDVGGLSHSKSELGIYDSFEELATKASPLLLMDSTPGGLEALLKHRGFPIIAQPHRKENFQANLTDGRVFLNNDDGSHHFAAARTLAARFNVPVPLQAPMEFTYIDLAALQTLRLRFEIFFIAMHSEFQDAMTRGAVSYCSMPLRSVHGPEDPTVILLPKSVPTSKIVAEELTKLGYQNLGEHLAKLAAKQGAIEQQLIGMHDRNTNFQTNEACQNDIAAPAG